MGGICRKVLVENPEEKRAVTGLAYVYKAVPFPASCCFCVPQHAQPDDRAFPLCPQAHVMF